MHYWILSVVLSSHTQLSSSLDSGVKEDLYFDLDTAGDSGCVQRSKLSTEDPHKEVAERTFVLKKRSMCLLPLHSSWKRQSSHQTLKREMPPLHSSSPFANCKDSRRLQSGSISLLAQDGVCWVSDGLFPQAERERTAGGSWFNMPAPELTPELRNDLKVVQMRNVLDRSHHYKSSDWKKGKLPKYFQVSKQVIHHHGDHVTHHHDDHVIHHHVDPYCVLQVLHSHPCPGWNCYQWACGVLFSPHPQETAEEDSCRGAACWWRAEEVSLTIISTALVLGGNSMCNASPWIGTTRGSVLNCRSGFRVALTGTTSRWRNARKENEVYTSLITLSF